MFKSNDLSVKAKFKLQALLSFKHKTQKNLCTIISPVINSLGCLIRIYLFASTVGSLKFTVQFSGSTESQFHEIYTSFHNSEHSTYRCHPFNLKLKPSTSQPTHFLEIFTKTFHQVNTNKGSVVKQSGDDVESCRSQEVLFQPNMRVFPQYSVSYIALHFKNSLGNPAACRHKVDSISTCSIHCIKIRLGNESNMSNTTSK